MRDKRVWFRDLKVIKMENEGNRGKVNEFEKLIVCGGWVEGEDLKIFESLRFGNGVIVRIFKEGLFGKKSEELFMICWVWGIIGVFRDI